MSEGNSVINIWSKSDDVLGASLTNPTETSVYYGKLTATFELPPDTPIIVTNLKKKTTFVKSKPEKGDSFVLAYPLQCADGMWYADAEAAYQHHHSKYEGDRKLELMTRIINSSYSPIPPSLNR